MDSERRKTLSAPGASLAVQRASRTKRWTTSTVGHSAALLSHRVCLFPRRSSAHFPSTAHLHLSAWPFTLTSDMLHGHTMCERYYYDCCHKTIQPAVDKMWDEELDKNTQEFKALPIKDRNVQMDWRGDSARAAAHGTTVTISNHNSKVLMLVNQTTKECNCNAWGLEHHGNATTFTHFTNFLFF